LKNLNPYSGDCFSFHKLAVNRKNSSPSKSRLLKIEDLIKRQYTGYQYNFRANTLHKVKTSRVATAAKADLIPLYRYQSKTIKEIREKIRDKQVQTIKTTCQNCTINSANTLDHILPKDTFPAFVVNPLNLFPCCSECNSIKNDSSSSKFLNLYLDSLPQEQYLFVEVQKDKGGDLNFNYTIRNDQNKISSDVFSIIESHYNELRLLERFKLKSVELIKELEIRITNFQSILPISDVIACIEKSIEEGRRAYGYNHWKYILELSLINNPLFLSQF
jgi:5-methylcytosine-specific restriction endonuclease McrA